MPAIYIYLTLF